MTPSEVRDAVRSLTGTKKKPGLLSKVQLCDALNVSSGTIVRWARYGGDPMTPVARRLQLLHLQEASWLLRALPVVLIDYAVLDGYKLAESPHPSTFLTKMTLGPAPASLERVAVQVSLELGQSFTVLEFLAKRRRAILSLDGKDWTSKLRVTCQETALHLGDALTLYVSDGDARDSLRD